MVREAVKVIKEEMEKENIKVVKIILFGREAKDEIKTDDPATNTVYFHSQQSVEKYLKAYLSAIGEPFGKTDNIAELIEKC